MSKSSRKTTGDYDVGYGKPPRHTQFQPGQPRPPRKPKMAELPDFNLYMAEELSQMVEVPGRNGQTERLTMGRLLIRQLVTKAAKTGDMRQLWAMMPKDRGEADAPFSQLELDIIRRALRGMIEPDSASADRKNDSVDGHRVPSLNKGEA